MQTNLMYVAVNSTIFATKCSGVEVKSSTKQKYLSKVQVPQSCTSVNVLSYIPPPYRCY